MRGLFTALLVIFEVLGLIITIVERRDRIKYGFKRARAHFIKEPPTMSAKIRSKTNDIIHAIKNRLKRK